MMRRANTLDATTRTCGDVVTLTEDDFVDELRPFDTGAIAALLEEPPPTLRELDGRGEDRGRRG